MNGYWLKMRPVSSLYDEERISNESTNINIHGYKQIQLIINSIYLPLLVFISLELIRTNQREQYA